MDTKVPILQVVLLFQMQLCPRNLQQQTQPKVSEKSGKLVRVAFGKEVHTTCKQICKIRDLNYFDAHLFFHEVTTFMLCYLSPLNISISARAIKI